MVRRSPEALIRPFLLYGGLLFTIVHRGVVLLMVLLFVHLFVVTVVSVAGDSMDPTLRDKTYLLVDELTPYVRPLRRGEIVAFRYPLNPGQKFIKRIIGLPGELVIVRDGHVFIQRPDDPAPVRLREPYLVPGLTTEGADYRRLPPADYYLLGDNRTVSFDSRYFGSVPDQYIIGRAWLAIWPPSAIRLISHFDPLTASD